MIGISIDRRKRIVEKCRRLFERNEVFAKISGCLPYAPFELHLLAKLERLIDAQRRGQFPTVTDLRQHQSLTLGLGNWIAEFLSRVDP